MGCVINFIETLLGVAAATALGAIVTFAMKRRELAKRLGIIALIAGAVGGALELYVRR